jgi:hypothetical protein
MTKRIAIFFRKFASQDSVYSRVVEFVIGGLLFKRGMEGENVIESGVNVEDLFNAVYLLAERMRLEAAPFVGSWHTVVEELDQIEDRQASPAKTVNLIKELVKRQISNPVEYHLEDFLERELEKLSYQRPKPGRGRVFERVAEQMIVTLREIVFIEDSARVKYLRPLIALAKKQKTIVVATLNYDNAIELAAKSGDVPCDTGIIEWSNNGKFSFPSEGITLLKLHGSIDWMQERIGGPGKIEHLAVGFADIDSMKKNLAFLYQGMMDPSKIPSQFCFYRPAVIFGQRNKLTTEGPFFDLLQTFVQMLDVSDLLTIIGYSFGDPHINALLARWMNRDSRRRLRIINPNYDKIQSKFTDDLSRELGDRVEVFKEKTGSALTKLYDNYQ